MGRGKHRIHNPALSRLNLVIIAMVVGQLLVLLVSFTLGWMLPSILAVVCLWLTWWIYRVARREIVGERERLKMRGLDRYP